MESSKEIVFGAAHMVTRLETALSSRLLREEGERVAAPDLGSHGGAERGPRRIVLAGVATPGRLIGRHATTKGSFGLATKEEADPHNNNTAFMN